MWTLIAGNHHTANPPRRLITQNILLKTTYRNTKQSDPIENHVHTNKKRLLKTKNSMTNLQKRMSALEKSLSPCHNSMTTNQKK
jgi:uncharacterized coiled-coil DUF342 family protein